jgi:excisionase family DNA binding protein
MAVAMAEPETYLTVEQAAQRLGIHEETVRRWLRSGKLRGNLLSERAGYRIPASEVERLLTGRSPAD